MQSQSPEQLPDLGSIMIKGLQNSLSQAFSIKPERVQFVPTTNRIKMAEYIAKQTAGPSGKVTWPLLMMHMPSMSAGFVENMHAYNTKSLARRGVYLNVEQNFRKVLKVNPVAAVLDIEVVYMTDAWEQAFDFSCRWIANAVHNRANFSITYGNFDMDIRVQMEPTLATPPREESVDQPNVFEYTSSLKVAGYITDTHPNGASNIEIVRPHSQFRLSPNQRDAKVWGPNHETVRQFERPKE